MESDPLSGDAALRSAIRAEHERSGRRIVALDDDPTGSQSVHDVSIVTTTDPGALAAALERASSTCFVLTNSRSLDTAAAVEHSTDAAGAVFSLEERLGAPIELVSRSDSTLRGHVAAEIEALRAARRDRFGRDYDAVVFVPAYLEAGRFTEGDVHYARVGGVPVPVGETEFAADATFGYRSSNLAEFLVEVSMGTIARESVTSCPLELIRGAGPDGVAELLDRVATGGFVVVNATTYTDLEAVALGVCRSAARGRRFLFRSGPSFVRALSGVEPRPVLSSADIFPDGPSGRHGLVVVGSHVGLTNDQLGVATAEHDLTRVELDVAALATRKRRATAIAEATRAVRAGIAERDVLLLTSRTLRHGSDPAASLEIARAVSSALVEVVRGARDARPGFVIAKGGITSHDIAVHGLEIRRAVVVGQLLVGMVSLLRPIEASAEAIGIPFVVFAGNVGDATTLSRVIATLSAAH